MSREIPIQSQDSIPFESVSDESFARAKFFNSCRLAESGCWLWIGYRQNGYGHITLDGRPRGAHVWSHELFKGPVPRGLFVLHSCDTPACVNPAHLRAGTAKENVHDCISRGRFRTSKGASNNLSKLTDQDIVDIRNSTLSPKDLSLKYGIDRTNVHQIVTGATWPHVPMPAQRVQKGDGRAKLTRSQVIEIKNSDPSVSLRELSSRYGVGSPLVCMIRKGQIWKSITAEAQENVNGD
jgi:hypothetical protein